MSRPPKYMPSCNCDHCTSTRRSFAPEWRNVYVHPAMLSDGDVAPAVALAARHGRVAVITHGGRRVRLQYPPD